MESVAQLTAEPTPDYELLTPSSPVGPCSLPSFEMVSAVHATPAHGGIRSLPRPGRRPCATTSRARSRASGPSLPAAFGRLAPSALQSASSWCNLLCANSTRSANRNTCAFAVSNASRISRFASASMDVSWGSVLSVRTQRIFRAIEKEFARINALDQGEWNDQLFFDKRIGRDPHDAGLAVNDVDRANQLPVGVVDLEPHRKRANDFRVVHAAGSAHAEAFSVRMTPAPASVALPRAPSSTVKPIASGPGE